jgi:hypothetical protein
MVRRALSSCAPNNIYYNTYHNQSMLFKISQMFVNTFKKIFDFNPSVRV